MTSLIVVEDEPLVAMMIEEMAQDLGWTVDGSAHTEADAFILLKSRQPDLALLDIHLGLATSLAVADACRDRGIPVIFITGYTARDIPSLCGNDPILPKPFTLEDMASAFRRSLAHISAGVLNDQGRYPET
jgi:CheY-like chemotaxis protein